jgi:glucose/arabinose dehydrogenase
MNHAKAGSGSVFRSRLVLARTLIAAAFLVALLLAACTGSAPGPGPTQGNGPELLRKLDLNLTLPWSIVFLGDGTAIISERDTKLIKSVRNGRSTTVGEFPGVVPGGEGGLLGLALSPEFASDRLLYAYFTAESDNRISRTRLEQAADGG